MPEKACYQAILEADSTLQALHNVHLIPGPHTLEGLPLRIVERPVFAPHTRERRALLSAAQGHEAPRACGELRG